MEITPPTPGELIRVTCDLIRAGMLKLSDDEDSTMDDPLVAGLRVWNLASSVIERNTERRHHYNQESLMAMSNGRPVPKRFPAKFRHVLRLFPGKSEAERLPVFRRLLAERLIQQIEGKRRKIYWYKVPAPSAKAVEKFIKEARTREWSRDDVGEMLLALSFWTVIQRSEKARKAALVRHKSVDSDSNRQKLA